ncbi:epoxide hydrolase family protein [Microbacterium sp. SLBN-111]|uniref:epoxide hydrolase family protein n=1 Tax=Microbacterium sp. SLBN-111 TaxID=3377733 RepID=UPI003C7375A1
MIEPVASPWVPTWDPAAIEDLRARLARTRSPIAPPDTGWSEGMDAEYLADLLTYWRDGFDFGAALAGIRRFPWFEAEVSPSVRLRFIHRTGVGARTALLLCHGWPDSAWRYADVIDTLADPEATGGDPADAFDVIVPEMPGYGFSPAADPAPDARAVADAFASLMQILGYERYVVAGGDIGSSVARFVALNHPERVIAVHRMDVGIPVFTGDPATLAPEEREFLAAVQAWSSAEGAYAAMHRTKPATIAAALSDSPAGLAAWIVEKLQSWTDPRGGELGGISRDAMLTLLTTTWVMNSSGPSVRMYRANGAIPPTELLRKVEQPSGFTLYPGDLLAPPRAWAERVAAVESFRVAGRGGHFAPREVPDEYAAELRDFFRAYR